MGWINGSGVFWFIAVVRAGEKDDRLRISSKEGR